MSNSTSVTRKGLEGVRPDREARIGENAGPRPGREGPGRKGGGIDSMLPKPQFQSYYGLPVLNKPTWEPLDIAGYFFLGGLAGSSSALAAASSLTGRPVIARRLHYGAAGAISLSLAALVHDLGRPSRFYNMLRVFKPTSPMSVGTWILALYGPAAIGTAVLDAAVSAKVPPWCLRPLTRPLLGRLARPLGLAAGVLGPAVATYTAVLVADTAPPAWHDGHREMPFVFAGSASAAGAGFGLLAGATRKAAAETGPARRLAVTGAVTELVASRVMRRRMGLVAECYEQGRAGRLIKAAEAATASGAALAAAAPLFGRRRRFAAAAGGACLLAGSALTRFGIFFAGVQSAEDPRYTVIPQRQRLQQAAGATS